MPSPPRFDHDEARRLRAAGWTYTALAARYGVSDNAVARVCDPAVRARMAAISRQVLLDRRTPCRGGCGALVWTYARQERSGYCPQCLGDKRRADSGPHHGKETEYVKWKCRCEPCRLAANEARRRRRAARAVPCKNCGTPRSHPDDNRTTSRKGYEDSGLCRACWHVAAAEARKKAAA